MPIDSLFPALDALHGTLVKNNQAYDVSVTNLATYLSDTAHYLEHTAFLLLTMPNHEQTVSTIKRRLQRICGLYGFSLDDEILANDLYHAIYLATARISDSVKLAVFNFFIKEIRSKRAKDASSYIHALILKLHRENHFDPSFLVPLADVYQIYFRVCNDDSRKMKKQHSEVLAISRKALSLRDTAYKDSSLLRKLLFLNKVILDKSNTVKPEEQSQIEKKNTPFYGKSIIAHAKEKYITLEQGDLTAVSLKLPGGTCVQLRDKDITATIAEVAQQPKPSQQTVFNDLKTQPAESEHKLEASLIKAEASQLASRVVLSEDTPTLQRADTMRTQVAKREYQAMSSSVQKEIARQALDAYHTGRSQDKRRYLSFWSRVCGFAHHSREVKLNVSRKLFNDISFDSGLKTKYDEAELKALFQGTLYQSLLTTCIRTLGDDYDISSHSTRLDCVRQLVDSLKTSPAASATSTVFAY